MSDRLTIPQLRHRRLAAQGLLPSAAHADALSAVTSAAAIQAQELPAAHLAIRARTAGLAEADVRRAREIDRSIVLTWVMRGTLHLVPAADLGWMLALFGAPFIRSTARRYRQLGLDATTLQRAAALIPEILTAHGPLPRPALADALAPHGVPVAGQAIYHLLRYAALAGLICLGPEVDGDLTYVLLDDWLGAPPPLSENQMAAELARRYFRAYSPATLTDFVTWSGLSVGVCRAGLQAIAGEVIEVAGGHETAWALRSQGAASWEAAPPVVRLLPRYDSLLLGYQDRAWLVADEFTARLHPGGGLIRPAVIVDGAAVATWRLETKGSRATVTLEPFTPLAGALMPLLEAEAADIGRFLGITTALRVEA